MEKMDLSRHTIVLDADTPLTDLGWEGLIIRLMPPQKSVYHGQEYKAHHELLSYLRRLVKKRTLKREQLWKIKKLHLELRTLPGRYFEELEPATKYMDPVLRVDRTDPAELMETFHLSPREWQDSRIIVVPTKGRPLQPFADYVYERAGSYPEFAMFDITLYSGSYFPTIRRYEPDGGYHARQNIHLCVTDAI